MQASWTRCVCRRRECHHTDQRGPRVHVPRDLLPATLRAVPPQSATRPLFQQWARRSRWCLPTTEARSTTKASYRLFLDGVEVTIPAVSSPFDWGAAVNTIPCRDAAGPSGREDVKVFVLSGDQSALIAEMRHLAAMTYLDLLLQLRFGSIDSSVEVQTMPSAYKNRLHLASPVTDVAVLTAFFVTALGRSPDEVGVLRSRLARWLRRDHHTLLSSGGLYRRGGGRAAAPDVSPGGTGHLLGIRARRGVNRPTETTSGEAGKTPVTEIVSGEPIPANADWGHNARVVSIGFSKNWGWCAKRT